MSISKSTRNTRWIVVTQIKINDQPCHNELHWFIFLFFYFLNNKGPDNISNQNEPMMTATCNFDNKLSA